MAKLKSSEQILIDFHARKLSVQGFDFDKAYTAVITIHQQIQSGSQLSLDEKKAYLAGYGLIRDIAALEALLDHLTQFNLSQEQMQKCCALRDAYEARPVESKREVRLFQSKKVADFSVDSLIDLFKRLVDAPEKPTPKHGK